VSCRETADSQIGLSRQALQWEPKSVLNVDDCHDLSHTYVLKRSQCQKLSAVTPGAIESCFETIVSGVATYLQVRRRWTKEFWEGECDSILGLNRKRKLYLD